VQDGVEGVLASVPVEVGKLFVQQLRNSLTSFQSAYIGVNCSELRLVDLPHHFLQCP
jgi:hypothetical protein